MPGQSPLLAALLDRAREDRIYVRGVVSTVGEKGDGIVEVGGQVVKSGSEASAFHNQVLVPANVPPEHRPDWAMGEFSAGQIHAAKMMAIVHTKAIVVDPFSDDCAVVTGSHNFSDSASAKNDENLVIVRGDRALAQAYAVHMSGVYDGYAWRAFLNAGATPGRLYRMAGWKPGGARHRELSFWMS
jgi:phosphatidylserine/phosphatidylglycerophosphate/cardiolipin synthase-like enzyme